MILQLSPALPLSTPKGNGLCHLVIDYGEEADLVWVVFLESGEIWAYRNQEVRAQKNITMGRRLDSESADNYKDAFGGAVRRASPAYSSVDLGT